MELFEPSMTATVELTELYGPEPGGIFDFQNRKLKSQSIKTCLGDLYVMCNALEDYANILDGVIKEWGLEGFHAAYYELHAARCRELSRKYAKEIHYDYEEAVRKYEKRKAREASGGDIGEEALALHVKRSEKQAIAEQVQLEWEKGGE